MVAVIVEPGIPAHPARPRLITVACRPRPRHMLGRQVPVRHRLPMNEPRMHTSRLCFRMRRREGGGWSSQPLHHQASKHDQHAQTAHRPPTVRSRPEKPVTASKCGDSFQAPPLAKRFLFCLQIPVNQTQHLGVCAGLTARSTRLHRSTELRQRSCPAQTGRL